ncbi:MAG: insulinase family protein [Parcubacteria group bacterium]|nr:insulinase family protein [Parcubacteria group bacterium]
MYKFQVKNFPNGLRLLMVPSKESLSFQITTLVNTGADFETKNLNGISHFLEHMCFKGTKKRPTNLDIAKELDRVGGIYNAFTGREYTGYFVRVAKEYQQLAIDIVSDIYLNSQFPEAEIEKERGVIIEEINMYHDDPKSYIDELWIKLLYGNQPAGWSIAGTKTNIHQISRRDFLTYHQQQYRSQSTLIIVSGNFKTREVTNLIQQAFVSIPRGKAKNKIKAKEKQKQPQLIFEKRNIDQTHIILGVRGINIFDQRRYALNVFDSILSGGMSSRLFQLVRGKLGAAYYIDSGIEAKTDTGYWAVISGLDSKRVELILKEILAEWQSFKKIPVSSQEMTKAKEFMMGQMALAFEDVHKIASFYGTQLLLKKKIENYQEYLRKIKQVTSRDVQKLANDLLKPECLNLAMVGPHSTAKQFKKILHI